MKMAAKMAALVFFVSLSLSALSAAHAAGEKIVFMDLGKVFDDYNKTKDLDKQLEAKSTSKQADRDKMVTEIKKMKDELDLAADKDKAKKQAAVEEKLKKLQDFDNSSRNELKKDRDDMARTILGEIKNTIDEIGKKEGYAFILDSRAILFGNDADNLTSRVLKILNDRYSAKGKK